jgi:hypothetical protein
MLTFLIAKGLGMGASGAVVTVSTAAAHLARADMPFTNVGRADMPYTNFGRADMPYTNVVRPERR